MHSKVQRKLGKRICNDALVVQFVIAVAVITDWVAVLI